VGMAANSNVLLGTISPSGSFLDTISGWSRERRETFIYQRRAVMENSGGAKDNYNAGHHLH
jgi:hypothetical protein